VYPLLQLFVDQGLVEGLDADGRRVFGLTEAGRAKADRGRLRGLADASPVGSGRLRLRAELEQLNGAARQVGTEGRAEQVEQAVEVVRGARKAIYRLLADQ